MEYVIPVVLVVLLIGGLVIFFVMNATKKSGPVADEDQGAPGIGTDSTPLGDTTEHAGEQSEHGTTERDPEAGVPTRTDPDAAAHVARPGEGEGEERLEFEGRQPERGDELPRERDDVVARDEPQGDDELPRDRGEDERGEDEERLGREQPRPASERLADRDF